MGVASSPPGHHLCCLARDLTERAPGEGDSLHFLPSSPSPSSACARGTGLAGEIKGAASALASPPPFYRSSFVANTLPDDCLVSLSSSLSK